MGISALRRSLRRAQNEFCATTFGGDSQCLLLWKQLATSHRGVALDWVGACSFFLLRGGESEASQIFGNEENCMRAILYAALFAAEWRYFCAVPSGDQAGDGG